MLRDDVLRLTDVHAHYLAGVPGCALSVWALRGVTLRVRWRQVVAITGAPGSGKSTLLRCMAGVVAPTAGRVERGAPVWVAGRAGTDAGTGALLLRDADPAPASGWPDERVVGARAVVVAARTVAECRVLARPWVLTTVVRLDDGLVVSVRPAVAATRVMPVMPAIPRPGAPGVPARMAARGVVSPPARVAEG
jgi:energy-coupling factor transporter ATP-binding protein EcfA2